MYRRSEGAVILDADAKVLHYCHGVQDLYCLFYFPSGLLVRCSLCA